MCQLCDDGGSLLESLDYLQPVGSVINSQKPAVNIWLLTGLSSV